MKSYRYIDGESVFETEIKRSRFIATLFGEADENTAEAFVKKIKRKYADATHNCYAYICGENGTQTRFSDDGEPSGTAGQPMLEVLKKQYLTNTAVVVTRYFGGIKLGAGGLVGAYTSAVVNAVKAVGIAQKAECATLSLKADFGVYAGIEGYLKKTVIFEKINFTDCVFIDVCIPFDSVDKIVSDLKERTNGCVDITKTGVKYCKIDI